MSGLPQQVGPYAVEAEIGRGGMGVVYRATDSRLGRTVAIKALPNHFAADPDRLARFEREARTLASLNHPNVAGIYGVEEHGGSRYLVLELVEGETLAERLDRGPLPIDDALELCAEVALGVEAAHEAGVVHRDLKPGNIKITPDGRAKVLDFGLAKSGEAAGSSSAIEHTHTPTVTAPPTPHSPTVPGAIMGTAPYMSPEQARGRTVDRRTDIWSLGVILYECLTGLSPFAGETATDSIGAILHKDVDLDLLPRDTPVRVRDLLERCLQRDRLERQRDAGDVALELQRARRETGASSPKPVRRRNAPALIGAAAAVGAIAFIAAWFTKPQGEAPATDPVPTRFIRVTDFGGGEMSPSIAPDGESVVFVGYDNDGRDSDLFLSRVGSYAAINLTAGAPGADTQPAFSPDGSRIAFWSDRSGGGLWIMGTAGESPRRVSDFGANPSWSPDGAQIVFATESVLFPNGRNSISSLWTVPADGSAPPTKLFDGDAVQPAWSPNGDRIAYWALVEGGQREIFTIPASGGEPVRLTDHPAIDWNPVWSPDGRRIYFCSTRGGAMSAWQVRIVEATGAPKGEPSPFTAGGGVETIHLSVAPGAGRVAYAAVSPRINIESVELDSDTGAITDGPTRLLASSSAEMFPSVTADGARIVATVQRDSEGLIILDDEGRRLTQLVPDSARDRAPRWSPDGNWIASMSDRDGRYEIWIIRADGSGLRQITDHDTARIRTPAWLPTGDGLLFATDSGVYSARFEPGGSDPVVIERLQQIQGVNIRSPQGFSPSGRRLTLGSFGDIGFVVEVIDYESGEVVWRTEEHAGAAWFDEDRLLLINSEAVEMVDIRSGEVTTLLESGTDTFVEYISYSPVSRRAYYTRQTVESDVWVADLGD